MVLSSWVPSIVGSFFMGQHKTQGAIVCTHQMPHFVVVSQEYNILLILLPGRWQEMRRKCSNGSSDPIFLMSLGCTKHNVSALGQKSLQKSKAKLPLKPQPRHSQHHRPQTKSGRIAPPHNLLKRQIAILTQHDARRLHQSKRNLAQ